MSNAHAANRSRIVLLVVATMVTAILALAAGSATAQTDPYGNGEPSVLPTLIQNVETTDGQASSSQRPSTLPFTGTELSLFVVIGAAAIGSGMFLVKRSRSRSRA